MQNSIYIYAYDSQKPLYFLEEKINLFKPIQVVWRYTWKAEIVSTRPSITWRASWTRYPYFIWCFSDPVAPREKKRREHRGDGKGEMVQRKPREEGTYENSPSWLTRCCSVAKSYPTVWPHELQHTRLPWPSPSPSLCSNSWPLSREYHPIISSSVTTFFSCPQSFPGLWQSVGSLHQVAKVLELQLQHQSLQWIFRVNFL